MQTEIIQLYPLLEHPVQKYASQYGMQIKVAAHYIDVIHDSNIVRLNIKHFVYIYDIIKSFDYYFSAVKPNLVHNGAAIVDYSTPRYHDVVGIDLMPVFSLLSQNQ